MRNLTLIAGMTVLMVGLTSNTVAQQRGRQGCGISNMSGGMKKMCHGESRGMGRMMGGMCGLRGQAGELDLTKEQTHKMRELAVDWAEKRIDLTAAQQKAQLKLMQALRADEVDMKEVEKQLDAVFQAKKDLKLGKIRHRTEVRQLLTEEQREKLGDGPMGCPMMRKRGGKHPEKAKGQGMHRGMKHGGKHTEEAKDRGMHHGMNQ